MGFNKPLHGMKKTFTALLSVLALASCVFEEPFEPLAKVPVDEALTGLWEEVPKDSGSAPNRLLVLKHSANEYHAVYPVGEKAMFFRAYAVDLSGERCIQIQLTGTADGPVKEKDRKHHLLKVETDGKSGMVMRTIRPETLGKDLKGGEAMREAFTRLKGDADLFGEPQRFKRIE